ncbi:MAG: citrate lyase holo-[acyl-carrier protein] synthase [Clostridia bacterium]|nr:citrate lyase holo-[acyl-carrier protein] synthase [Clostridia bacterium]
MDIEKITLDEILAARDQRAASQLDLIKKYNKPIISLSMNIAGEIKTSPLILFAFWEAVANIENEIKVPLLYRNIIKGKAGPEALYVFDGQAEIFKETAIEIETANPVGRLFDIDVISLEGKKLSRTDGRSCIVCGGPVTICSRSRAHGLDAVNDATQTLLLNFASDRLASLAVQALIKEAELSPKPGLVDSNNNGAHQDMDLDMFLRSAAVLRPYFVDCVRLGAREDDCMEKLQEAGILAEYTMLKETGGVNTHKGAIFALGIYLGALGGTLLRGGDVFGRCRQLINKKLSINKTITTTHGAQVKQIYKVGGAMEEALLGFPTAKKGAEALKESEGDALYALLRIMENLEDTNLLYRGGLDALTYVKERASEILRLSPEKRKNALFLMDQECMERNISPGGSADMLALALLMDSTAAINIDYL